MKTKILSIILLFAVVSGFSKSTHAAANSADYTLLKEIKAVNRIEVRGNVELFISDSPVEQVKVYNKYYSENALVQYNNGTLRITSYNAEKLIVWVSTDDLRAVTAYDNAEVRSFGKLSKIEFNVDLHNNASANLNLDAYSANVKLNDHAKAQLSGTATEFGLTANANTTVVKSDFKAEYITNNKINAVTAAKNDDLTILE
jgi:DNA-directed RNA polymerase alpha subunit